MEKCYGITRVDSMGGYRYIGIIVGDETRLKSLNSLFM